MSLVNKSKCNPLMQQQQQKNNTKSCNCLQDSSSPPSSKDECVDRSILEVLQNELNTVKSQLASMTNNKCQMLNATNELKQKYNDLLNNKCALHREIDRLQTANCQLQRELASYRTDQHSYQRECVATKAILEEYESKLAQLHGQFVEHAQIVEQAKKKFTKYLKRKNKNLKELMATNCGLLETIESKDQVYEQLRECYENLKKEVVAVNESRGSSASSSVQRCSCRGCPYESNDGSCSSSSNSGDNTARRFSSKNSRNNDLNRARRESSDVKPKRKRKQKQREVEQWILNLLNSDNNNQKKDIIEQLTSAIDDNDDDHLKLLNFVDKLIEKIRSKNNVEDDPASSDSQSSVNETVNIRDGSREEKKKSKFQKVVKALKILANVSNHFV